MLIWIRSLTLVLWMSVAGSASAVQELTTIALVGDQPAGAAEPFSSLSPQSVTETGTVLVRTVEQIDIGGGSQMDVIGFFEGDGTSLDLVVRAGTGAPGITPAESFSWAQDAAYDADGNVGFNGSVGSFPAFTTGLWGPTPAGALDALLVPGDATPFVAAGTTLAKITSPGGPNFVGARDFITHASLNLGVGGVTSANDSVYLRRDSAGTYSVVLREGDAAVGFPGEVYGNTLMRFSRNGHVMARSTLSPSGTGVYYADDGSGSLRVLGTSLGPAPTQEAVANWVVDSFAMDTARNAAVEGTYRPLAGGSYGALWTFTPDGTPTLEFRGDLPLASQVADVPPGVELLLLEEPHIENNIVVVTGRLQLGGSVTSANDNVLFASNAAGDFRLVAREGNPIPQGSPTELYTNFYSVEMNAPGQAVFGGGGVFYIDVGLPARTLLGPGDDVLVDGVPQTLAGAALINSALIPQHGIQLLSDSGWLIVDAAVPAGTRGVFRTQLPTDPVPALPTAWWSLLLILGLMAVAWKVRYRAAVPDRARTRRSLAPAAS